MKTAQQIADMIAEKIPHRSRSDQPFLRDDGEYEIEFRSDSHDGFHSYRFGVEDDDFPEFDHQGALLAAASAVGSTGWYITKVLDSEKMWFEIRFAKI